jgi:hypothetical protein
MDIEKADIIKTFTDHQAAADYIEDYLQDFETCSITLQDLLFGGDFSVDIDAIPSI